MKHIFITGGGSGIGQSIAQSMANAGYRVTVAGRNLDRLKASGFDYIQMDVTDPVSIKTGYDKACGKAPIDIFIAGAGAAQTAPAMRTSSDLWDAMINVNLTSIHRCAQVACPSMIDRGWGRFIAISSTAGLKGYRYTSAYAAAKHGVIGYIKCLALELAKTGVTANALCPGFTDTPLIDRAIDIITTATGRSESDARASFASSNPMEKLVTPDEVASAALWLSGEGASAINGQAIAIDGGETVA